MAYIQNDNDWLCDIEKQLGKIVEAINKSTEIQKLILNKYSSIEKILIKRYMTNAMQETINEQNNI